MDASTMPLDQLAEWVQDCRDVIAIAERRGDERLRADAVAELWELAAEYQYRTALRRHFAVTSLLL